jgi:hypothetical protein
MRDLPDVRPLDKNALFGGCVRLPVRIDAERLLREMRQVPSEEWTDADGRVGVHEAAAALFLRGYAPAEGDKPIEDRPVLDRLPYVREIIESIPAQPMRCLFAKLPAGASIPPHIDWAPYFWKTLRLHMAVETHDQAWMLCAGQSYLMKPGEIWMLNNNVQHGVWNAHPTLARTHLICDFVPDTALVEIIARGERDLGRIEPHVNAHFDS